MGRDTKKYAYFPVRISRESDTYARLMEDARSSGHENEISSLLAIRVADYYAGRRSAVAVDVVTEKPTVKSDAATAKSNAETLLDVWE